MAPLQNAEQQTGYALLIFLGGLAQMLNDADYLAHSPDGVKPLWNNLVDLDAIPDAAVPWLGQMVGVRVDLSGTADQQRQQIRDHTGWGRGRPLVWANSIRKFLLDTQTVIINERDGGAYKVTINTYEDETPPDVSYGDLLTEFPEYASIFGAFDTYGDLYEFDDVRDVIAAVLAANKPASLILTYTILPGSPSPVTYDDLYERGINYGDIWSSFQTYADIR